MKRNVSLLLSLIMVFALLPFSVFSVAAESDINLDNIVFDPTYGETDDIFVPSDDLSIPTDDQVDPDPNLPITPVKPAKKGDIDGDDDIDSMDYLYLKRAYFSQYALSSLAIGDIDNNGEITSMDYLYLKRAYFSQYVIVDYAALAGKYMVLSMTVEGETLDYETLYLLGMTDMYIQLNEDGTFVIGVLGEEIPGGVYDAIEGTLDYEDGTVEFFTIDGDILTIDDGISSYVSFTKGELPEINPDDYEDIWGDDEIVYPDVPLMTYDEYLAAGTDEYVYIESYVQGYINYGDGFVSAFYQSPEGGCYTFDASCTDEDLEKIAIGTKVRIKGYKIIDEFGGSVEIYNSAIEVVDDGDTYIAEAYDANELLGTDEFSNRQYELVSLKGLTVEEVYYLWEDVNSDVVLYLNYNGESYEFYMTIDLTGADLDSYQLIGELEVGDVVDVECFANWYEGFYGTLTSLTIAE